MNSLSSSITQAEETAPKADPQRRCEDLHSAVLSDRELIIAANRGPVTFEETEAGDLRSQRGGGGLVTALIGLCQHTAHAAWVACARSDADAAWQHGSVPLLDAIGDLQLQFLSPEPSAYEDYYHVISNPLLWFLQHRMWDTPRSPIIDRTTWAAWENGYVAINRQFAEAIADQIHNASRPGLVMLQDYHLYLAARVLRDLLPQRERPIVMHFIHIPWPGPEYWRILPPLMRHAILDGLCAVDVLGFQTQNDRVNFLRTCETLLVPANVNFKRKRVWYRNHATHVRDFPISINVESLEQLASSPEVASYHAEFESLMADRQFIVRVDRIEPSKNILRGFQAFEEMLELYPQHRERVVFLALLVPSRLVVDEYKRYLDELMSNIGRVNAKYGTSQWEPVRVLVGENYPRAIAALQLYDVLLVNSIVDGMNLVAKEGPIVNQRHGTVLLSDGTGAFQQLEPGVLKVSAFDIYGTAQVLHQALMMPAEERRVRAERLQWIIRREDISMWLCKQLEVVAELFPARNSA